MHAELAPTLYALAAALLFAIGQQVQNVGLATVDPRTGTMVSITASAAYFWVMAPFLLDWRYFLEPAVLIFVLIGLFRPALSANLAVAGMRHLGPTLASTLSSTSPLFGTLFGVVFLAEILTWQIGLGTVGIVAAVILLSRRDSRVRTDWPLWALALPVAAAALRSLGHLLSKIGMVTIPDPYFGGLVAFTVSALLTVGLRRAQGGARSGAQPVSLRTPGIACFAFAGLTMGTAIIALNQALLIGQIVTVVPIVAASPLFTMLLGILVFRREKLTPKVVAAVFIVVPSVVVIALGH